MWEGVVIGRIPAALLWQSACLMVQIPVLDARPAGKA